MAEGTFSFNQYNKGAPSKAPMELDIVEAGKDDPTLFVVAGLPKAGKSKVAKSLAKKNNAEIICLDEIRLEVTGHLQDQSKNDLVWSIAKDSIWKALKMDQNVVVDDTNTSYSNLKNLVKHLPPCHKKLVHVECDVKTSCKNIKESSTKKTLDVPKAVVEKMAKQLKECVKSATYYFEVE